MKRLQRTASDPYIISANNTGSAANRTLCVRVGVRVYALLCCQLSEGLAFGQEALTDQSEHEKQMTGCSFPFPQYYTSSPQDPPSTPKPTHACMRTQTHTPSPISAVLSAKTVV